MRRILISLFAFAVLTALATTAQEPSYWDTQSCDFCKTYNAQPGLREHCRFEFHNTSTGMVSLIYVDNAYWDKFTAMLEAQGKVHKSLMAGELVKMCEHCSTIEDLFKSGTRIEPFRSEKMYVVNFSSNTPEVVAKIHYHADRCRIQSGKDMNSK